MPSACFDCKLCYGHKLVWCHGCGKDMVQLSYKQFEERCISWNDMRENEWKTEGEKDLYDIFYNSEFICKSSMAAPDWPTLRDIISPLVEEGDLEWVYYDREKERGKVFPFIRRKGETERRYIENCVFSFKLA